MRILIGTSRQITKLQTPHGPFQTRSHHPRPWLSRPKTFRAPPISQPPRRALTWLCPSGRNGNSRNPRGYTGTSSHGHHLYHLCRQDTDSQHTSVQYSLFTSAERIARACALERSCHLVRTRLTLLLLSDLLFTTSTSSSSFNSSFHHDTRKRATIGTTRSSPRTPSTSSTFPGSPSRQAAPSRITLA